MNLIPTPSRLEAQGDALGLGEVGHEVAGQPELVCALERSRFRAPITGQVLLPYGTAKRLEDFEAGLRAVGLIAVNEIVVQTFDRPSHFRVKERNVRVDGRFVHVEKPVVGEEPLDSGERAHQLRRSEPLSSGGRITELTFVHMKRRSRSAL